MKDIFNEYKWSITEIRSVVHAPTYPKNELITTTTPPPLYQLGIKTSGRSDITYKGKDVSFAEGSVLYIPKEKNLPSVRYDKYIVEEGRSIVVFFDTAEELPDEAFVYELENPGLFVDRFRQLYTIWINKSPTYYCECMSLLYRLLAQLQRRGMTGHDTAYNKKRLTWSIAYIHKHFREVKIDQQQLAELSGMNYDYFRHIFKEAYDVSPLQYINRLKIDYAKELLDSRMYTMNEIAELVGFSSQYYFSRCFKSICGMSPTKYQHSNDIN